MVIKVHIGSVMRVQIRSIIMMRVLQIDHGSDGVHWDDCESQECIDWINHKRMQFWDAA